MQEGESRITVTIEVETYWGYKDKRVVQVDPGVGWPDGAVSDLFPVMNEMDEAVYKARRAQEYREMDGGDKG